MTKSDDSDIDDLDLDDLEAESLPLHHLQGDATSAHAFTEISRVAPSENSGRRPTAFLDGLRGLASFFVYFVSWDCDARPSIMKHTNAIHSITISRGSTGPRPRLYGVLAMRAKATSYNCPSSAFSSRGVMLL